ncbi:16S rRNA (cytidine(1402)-2'-O)-methyltransferase [Coriobacteriia bacterium Es71-Z0120]|uniref:16S rRNA (cytidine(1402)-2'-O)-methyltransferase n=1 Tax=Parvivirga hydrogeniphila TaxID=2939460 RepID=UPI0022608AFB|nr:16S rRNA (cytidine(1402)-2'-O)-methyltransferase [Parvivirga hydrogeniphila]MCL4079512.1 16S rRNA (cytidine(1402)-2'-O)-methyltransferase [Parvivirga hydrogeniphila]
MAASGQTGRLLVCATPIGNLADVTLRVLDELREADVCLAEDTRVTKRLFARYGIDTPLERFDEATASAKTPRVLERIAAGETVALVSDAGTPGISDPGSRLVAACIDAELPVDVLPGPSAVITALVASGLPTHAFFFGGFFPRKQGDRVRLLASLRDLDATLVFFESPRRLASALAAIAEQMPGRRGAVARELTKVHAEVVRGTVEELAAAFASREVKGEVVVLVGPPTGATQAVSDEDLAFEVEQMMRGGSSRSDAIKRVAQIRGVPKSRVYDAAHRAKEARKEAER